MGNKKPPRKTAEAPVGSSWEKPRQKAGCESMNRLIVPKPQKASLSGGSEDLKGGLNGAFF